jgi:hypothetical protein
MPPLQDTSQYYPPIYVLAFLAVSFPLAFPPGLCVRYNKLLFPCNGLNQLSKED